MGVHVSQRDLGNEEDLACWQVKERLERGAQRVQFAQVASKLTIPVAAEKQVVAFGLADDVVVAQQLPQLGGLEDYGALLAHQIRVVNIDEDRILAGLGRPRAALPGERIAGAYIRRMKRPGERARAHLPQPRLMTTLVLSDGLSRNCLTMTSMALSLSQ